MSENGVLDGCIESGVVYTTHLVEWSDLMSSLTRSHSERVRSDVMLPILETILTSRADRQSYLCL